MTAHKPPDQATLEQLAAEVLESSERLRQLSDRVYALLCNELRQERDRVGAPYWRRL